MSNVPLANDIFWLMFKLSRFARNLDSMSFAMSCGGVWEWEGERAGATRRGDRRSRARRDRR